MPVYMCNAVKGAIDDAAKQRIAVDITRIHCAETDAPAQFVHAFFVEAAASPPLGAKTIFVFGSIRAGRTSAQKERMISEMCEAVHLHVGIALEEIAMAITDVPAAWVLEGGEIMPEPGQEASWLARHGS